MKKSLSKYWLQTAFLVVLFFGAIGDSYAYDLGMLWYEKAGQNQVEKVFKSKTWEAVNITGKDARANLYIPDKNIQTDTVSLIAFSQPADALNYISEFDDNIFDYINKNFTKNSFASLIADFHNKEKGFELFGVIQTTPNGIRAWEKMLNANVQTSLRTNTGALEALSLPKGSRPNPNTYLDAGYISNHLSNFNGGVVKFSANAPTGTVGPPGGTFVLPKSLADDLVSQSNGSVSKLEEFLSLDSGALGSNPVRIDVPSPSGTRMPSGNELGANDQWIPGGTTAGGILEATVDQIQPGTYSVSSVF